MITDADVISRFENKIFYSPDGCWYWEPLSDQTDESDRLKQRNK